jgi:AraC family transcriptional regulator
MGIVKAKDDLAVRHPVPPWSSCPAFPFATAFLTELSVVLMFNPQNLQIEPLHLRRGNTHIQEIGDDRRLLAVHGEGSGCVLETKGLAVAAWLPLRGGIMVHSSGLSQVVRAREALITEPASSFRAVAHAGSRWLAVLGSNTAWEHAFIGMPANGVRLLPAMHAAGWELRRKAVAMARCAAPGDIERGLHALIGQIAAFQAPLHAAMARSPGRSFNSKLQVFLRLQRVRMFMAAYCERELNNEALARIANYSPCHFLRTFRTVFLETPHAYLVRRRLRRAEELLRSGQLGVADVALASGFENRSAFSRRYRQHFGVTADEVRRRHPRRVLQGNGRVMG